MCDRPRRLLLAIVLAVATLLSLSLWLAAPLDRVRADPTVTDPTQYGPSAGHAVDQPPDRSASPQRPDLRFIRIVGWDAVRGRDDMQLINTWAGRNIKTVYAALMTPANFGPTGTIKCGVQIQYVNAIAPGSLISGGVRQADVFFGAEINGLQPVPLTVSEANELAAFINAGGIAYIAGDRDATGAPYHPLFASLSISDSFSGVTASSGSISYPLPSRVTVGPFGNVGYLSWTPFRTILTSTLQSIVTAGGGSSWGTIVAEGAFGTGYLAATGDSLAHDFVTVNANNVRYFLNLFALGCQSPNLAVYHSVTPETVSPGQAITYSINVANFSGIAATDLTITDRVPVAVINPAYTSSGLSLTPMGSVPYVWQVNTLAPQTTGRITVTGLVSPAVPIGTRITNTVTIYGTNGVTPTFDSSTSIVYVHECYATPDNGATIYRDVQPAIDAAPIGGTVKVAGTCAGVQLRSGSEQIATITKSLTLRGGYTFTNWASPGAQPTTLDGLNQHRPIWIGDNVTVTLQDLVVVNGHTSTSGGGVYAGSNGLLTLLDMQLLNNAVTDFSGGGLFAAGPVKLVRTNLIGNQASYGGGGVYAVNSIVVTGGLFKNNRAEAGGGLYAQMIVALTGTQFIRNDATTDGGALYATAMFGGDSRVVNAVFARNSAMRYGQALYVQAAGQPSSTFYLMHTTIASPTIGAGAAVYAYGEVRITNTLIASYTYGIQRGYVRTVSEDYNLFYHTTPVTGTVITGTHSLIDLDPRFTAIYADNYHVLSDSAAIDHGVNLNVPIDLDGLPRPIGAAPDIGAYEYVKWTDFVYLPLVKK